MPHAPINGIQLYYEELGSGVPLILVHGFFGSGKALEKQAQAFAAHYRVILPDLRAHGRSTSLPGTIHHSQFADDLVALLDHLGIERAHFVGYSSGGMSLLFVGTRHQARARTLTLVSATYTFDDHAKPVMRERADAREAAARADPENQQQRGPYFQELTDAFRGFTLGPPELPFTPDDLRQITVPVLILHGDRDVFFPVYIPVTMYQAMPNAELCIVPVAGHGVPGDPSGLFLTIISQFLARHADA